MVLTNQRGDRFSYGLTILGRGAGKTFRQAFGYGFTTLAATVFWSLIWWSGYNMIRQSMRLRYDGPVEALQEMAQTVVVYAELVAVPEVYWPAVVGTIFVSWFTEFFARRWS